MNDFEKQIERMKSLYSYGSSLNESKTPQTHTIEYRAVAADGKVYGIIRECNKYYIKYCPKGKETIAEAYDYIGGIRNKKNFEYESYNNAFKNFELKMNSINEAHDGKIMTESLKPFEMAGTFEGCSEEMKNEIARTKQIMHNASRIMNESTNYIDIPTVSQPEAETTNSGDKDAPFTEKNVKVQDGDNIKGQSCPKCQGNPFGEKKSTEKCKDVKVKDSVACQKPKGNKPVKLNEESFDLSEEDFGEDFGDESEDFETEDMDIQDGDEFDGDSLEYDKPEDFDGDDEDFGDESEESDEFDGDYEEGSDFGDDEESIDDLEAESDEDYDSDFSDENFGDDDENFGDDDEDFGNEEENFGDESEESDEFDGDYEEGSDFGDDEESIDDRINESINNYLRKKVFMKNLSESLAKKVIKEDKLNVFGQHPGYRKKVMTLPNTGEDKNQHGEDWNDSSVYSEEPFGSKKGDSAPFEKIVDVITDSIMKVLKENAKKKVK